MHGGSKHTLVTMKPHLPGSIFLVVVAVLCGCDLAAGPAYLRIETGGIRYDDFVIEPVQEYGRIHSSEMVKMAGIVVASEEDIVIPRFTIGPLFSTLLVSVYHPEFLYDWTGQMDSNSDELVMSPVRPRLWRDYIENEGAPSMQRAWNHLELMSCCYVPAFDEGAARQRLRRYLPGLREIVANSTWQSGDPSLWPSEDAARADLDARLEAIAAMLQ